MKIRKLVIILFLLYLISIPSYAAGESVISKAFLPYEVHNVAVTSSEITFTGWGLLIESQHFISSSDHSFELEFTSPQHTFRVSATTTNINLTELMRYTGIPLCALNAYFQNDTSCYYRYENVGYTVSVPLTMFQIDRQYTVYLVVHAKNANFHKKIPIYYPISTDILMMSGQKEYRVVSKLNDTKLTVKYASVIARKGPEKTSAFWYYGSTCSGTSGNLLYFLLDSVYTSIKERNFNLSSQTTYYRVASNLSICVGGRRRIVEGSTLTPVWIASSFVEYSGTPLIVSTKIINTAPVLIGVNAVVKVGENFNWQNNVTAFDTEEGDISNRIQLFSDNYHNIQIPGTYSMDFRVTDTYGASANKTIEITVVKADNTAPTIIAEDFEVLLNTSIDYHDYVSAFDKEDGDLTQQIQVATTADLTTPGSYPVCYDVTDSSGASVSKCIMLTVFDYATLMSRFRFVSYRHLFYNESIPLNWVGYTQRLTNMMETSEILGSIQIDP